MAGLSNAQDYKLSKHFMARANERFGIKNIVVSKWFRKQMERITEVDETEIEEEIVKKNKTKHRRLYRGKDGDIFVVDIKNKIAVTCYKSVDIRKKVNRNNNKVVVGNDLKKMESLIHQKDIVDNDDNSETWYLESNESETKKEIFNKYDKKDKNIENPETIHEVNLIEFKKELIALQRKYELMDSVELLNNIDADIERFYHSFHRIKDGNLTPENWEVLQLLIDSAHVINHVIKMIERKRTDYRYLKDNGMEKQYLDDLDDEM